MKKSQLYGTGRAVIALIPLLLLLTPAAFAANPGMGFGFQGNGFYPTQATDNSEYYARFTFDKGDNDNDPVRSFSSGTPNPPDYPIHNSIMVKNLLWFLRPDIDSYQQKFLDPPNQNNYLNATLAHERINYLGDSSYFELPCWVGSSFANPLGALQVGVPFPSPSPLGTLDINAGFALSPLNVPQTVTAVAPLSLQYVASAFPTNSLIGLSVRMTSGPAAGRTFPVDPTLGNTVGPPATINVRPDSTGLSLVAAGVAPTHTFVMDYTLWERPATNDSMLSYDALVGAPAQGYPANSLVGWYVRFTTGLAAGAPPFPITANGAFGSPDVGPPQIWNNYIEMAQNSAGNSITDAGAALADQFVIVSAGAPADAAFLNVAGGGGLTAANLPYSDVATGSPVGYAAGSLVGTSVSFTSGAAVGETFPILANTQGTPWPPTNFATITVGLSSPSNQTLVSAGVLPGDTFAVTGFTAPGMTQTNLPYSTTSGGVPGTGTGYPGDLAVTDANADGVDDGPVVDFLYHATPGRGPGAPRGSLPGEARGRKVRFTTGLAQGQEFYIEANNPNTITVFAPGGVGLVSANVQPGDRFFIVDDEFWSTPLGYPYAQTGGAFTTGSSGRSGRMGYDNGNDLVADVVGTPPPWTPFYDAPADIGDSDVYVVAQQYGRSVRFTVGPFSYRNGLFGSIYPFGYLLRASKDDNLNVTIEDGERVTAAFAEIDVASGRFSNVDTVAWFNEGVNPKLPDPLDTDPEEPVSKDDGTGSTIYTYTVSYRNSAGLPPRWNPSTISSVNFGGVDAPEPEPAPWFYASVATVTDDWTVGNNSGVAVILDGLFFWPGQMLPIDRSGNTMLNPGPSAGDFSSPNGQWYRAEFEPNFRNDYVSMAPGLHSYQFICSDDFAPPDNTSMVVTGRPVVSLFSQLRDPGDDVFTGLGLVHGNPLPEPIPWLGGTDYSVHAQYPNAKGALPYPLGAPWWLPAATAWTPPYGIPAENVIDGYTGNPDYAGQRPLVTGTLISSTSPDPFNYNPLFPSWGGNTFLDTPDPIGTTTHRVRDVDPVLYAITDQVLPRSYANYPQPSMYRYPGDFNRSLAHDLGFPNGTVVSLAPEFVFQYPVTYYYPPVSGTESGPRRQNDGTILPNMTPARDMTIVVDPDTAGPLPPQAVPDPIWTSEAQYTLRIRYVHDAGRGPTEAKVGIRRRQSTLPFFLDDMTKLVDPTNQWGDGNFQNGELYYYRFTPDQLGVPQGAATADPTLRPVPGQPNDYEYFFRFTGPSFDGTSTRTTIFPRRPPPDDIDLGLRPTPGDDVYWFRINSKPILAALDVSPDSGNEGTNFVYTITYTDPDGPFTAVSNPTGQVGDAPYSPKLYVDIFGDHLGLLKVDATTATGTGIETLTYSRVIPLGGSGYTGNNSIGGVDPNGYDTDTGANFDELYHQDTVTLAPRRAVKFHTGVLRGMIFPVNNNSPTTITVSAAAAVWGAGPAASGGASIDAGDRFSIVDFLPATMYRVTPGDNNYRDGAQYRWDSGTPNPFTPGTLHDYYAVFDDDPWDWFVPADPNFTRPGEATRFPETFNLVGPTIIANRAPFLATFRFAPDPPPAGTGSPDGNTATDFTFYVDYYDADDNAPTAVRLRIRNIDTNTFQEFEMAQVDPADTTYSNGATFSKTTKLAVGTYEFWAQCNDGQQQVPDPILAPGNAEWTGPQTTDPVGSPPANPPITVTAAQPGPEVVDNTPPILVHAPPDDDATPPLRPGLEPDNGTPSDTFTYTVKYIDNDVVGGQLGNPPSFVNVVIDGTVYPMAPVDPADTDYTGVAGPPATGGADFQFVTTTPFTAGLHNYYFQASDGQDTVRLPPDPATLPGPFIDAPAEPPTNLSAADVLPDQGYHVRLQWDASLDDGPPVDDVVEYRVFRTTTSGSYIYDPQDPATSLIAVIPATDAGTYVWVDGLVYPGGTPPVGAAATWTEPDKLTAYFYVVRAMETTDLTVAGNASSTSNQAPGTPTGVIPADNLSPGTPGGISCAPDTATGYVTVTWQASANDGGTVTYPPGPPYFGPGGPPFGSVPPEPGPAPTPPDDDVVGYRLYRSTTTPFTVGPANLIADETVGNGELISGTRAFLDTNTVLGETYYYKVQAFDGANSSGATAASGGCLATDSTPPAFVLTTPAALLNVPADTDFAFTVSDAGTGVDQTSIGASLDTWPVGGGTVGGVTFPQTAQPADLTITPTPATTPPESYDVVWDTPFDLAFATSFILTLQADDLLPPPSGPNSGLAAYVFTTTTTTGLSGTITLNPPLTGATTLTVTATGGTPLTVKTVTAVDAGGGLYNYVVAPLPPGTYNVQPSFPNTTFTYTGPTPLPVPVTLGSVTPNVNFTGNVTTITAAISGTISYPTGNIAAVFGNINIDVTGPVNLLNQPITSTGAYTIGGLVAGTYTVTPQWVGPPPALLFSPPPQVVTIPPAATGVDYIAYDPFPGFDVAFGLGTQLVAYPFTTPAAPNVVFGVPSAGDVARWDPRYTPTPRYITPAGPDPDSNAVLPVKPGRGYFTLNAAGSGPGGVLPPADRPFDIALWDEWNMCGNPWVAPFFWSTAVPSRAEIADFAWIYINDGVNQGYALVTDGSLLNTYTSVAPYRGFWLRVVPGTGLCSLSVPVPGSVVTAAKSGEPRGAEPLLREGWAVRVTAQAGENQDEWNFFGVGGGQVTEPIRIDNPPAMAGSVDVYFDGDDVGLPGRRLATDIRTVEPQGGEWEFVVATELPNAQVTVSLADLSYLPKTKQVLLTDLAADRTIFARTQSTYLYNSGQGGERRFKVSVSDKTDANLQVLNVTAQPARAGPGAEIVYTLNAPARVTTRIRNIAGRLIAEVEHGAVRDAGTHTVTWSGRTRMGGLAPNGLYLIGVDAVNDIQERASGMGRLHMQR